MNRRGLCRRACCLLLCAAVLSGAVLNTSGSSARAVPQKTLTLSQAQQLALAASTDITKKSNAITLKKMKYVEAVKAIKAKVKNLTSFRWTPLLSFKFPSELKVTEAFDLNVKPLLLQTEITTMQHALSDLRYGVLYKVNTAYLNAYILQEKSAFTTEKLALANTELARNRARLQLGEASQGDLDAMQKTVDKLTGEAASQARGFQQAKSDLTAFIKLDVTSGYRFQNAMFTANIPREQLAALTEYTLANSQSYFEAKMAASTALLTLNSYESLMRGQYGFQLHYIQQYINMAKQGQDIDAAAFQISYDAMLRQLDEPWNGYRRILFFKFPKEWFKGEIAGTRYIEDELYALYTACMEYAAAKKDLESAEKALRKEVADAYENIVTAGNSYRDILKMQGEAKTGYNRLLALNRLGQASFSELADKKDDYQASQLEVLDALSAYNELLYAFDRLTCGAVSCYFRGESLTSGAGEAGDSFAEVETPDSPHYYIYASVADMVFVFGLEIPDGYLPEITGYELWHSGVQIGTRTPAGTEIRHLTLDYGESAALTVKVFGADDYIGECEIDTAVPRDKLAIQQLTQLPAKTEEQIGTYLVSASPVGALNLSTITLKVNASVGASYYTVTHKDGAALSEESPIPLEKPFRYMALLTASLSDVKLTLYDANRQALREAFFSAEDQMLWSMKK